MVTDHLIMICKMFLNTSARMARLRLVGNCVCSCMCMCMSVCVFASYTPAIDICSAALTMWYVFQGESPFPALDGSNVA